MDARVFGGKYSIADFSVPINFGSRERKDSSDDEQVYEEEPKAIPVLPPPREASHRSAKPPAKPFFDAIFFRRMAIGVATFVVIFAAIGKRPERQTARAVLVSADDSRLVNAASKGLAAAAYPASTQHETPPHRVSSSSTDDDMSVPDDDSRDVAEAERQRQLAAVQAEAERQRKVLAEQEAAVQMEAERRERRRQQQVQHELALKAAAEADAAARSAAQKAEQERRRREADTAARRRRAALISGLDSDEDDGVGARGGDEEEELEGGLDGDSFAGLRSSAILEPLTMGQVRGFSRSTFGNRKPVFKNLPGGGHMADYEPPGYVPPICAAGQHEDAYKRMGFFTTSWDHGEWLRVLHEAKSVDTLLTVPGRAGATVGPQLGKTIAATFVQPVARLSLEADPAMRLGLAGFGSSAAPSGAAAAGARSSPGGGNSGSPAQQPKLPVSFPSGLSGDGGVGGGVSQGKGPAEDASGDGATINAWSRELSGPGDDVGAGAGAGQAIEEASEMDAQNKAGATPGAMYGQARPSDVGVIGNTWPAFDLREGQRDESEATVTAASITEKGGKDSVGDGGDELVEVGQREGVGGGASSEEEAVVKMGDGGSGDEGGDGDGDEQDGDGAEAEEDRGMFFPGGSTFRRHRRHRALLSSKQGHAHAKHGGSHGKGRDAGTKGGDGGAQGGDLEAQGGDGYAESDRATDANAKAKGAGKGRIKGGASTKYAAGLPSGAKPKGKAAAADIDSMFMRVFRGITGRKGVPAEGPLLPIYVGTAVGSLAERGNAWVDPRGSALLRAVGHVLESLQEGDESSCEASGIACSEYAREVGVHFHRHMLGRCAIVGLGPNLLYRVYGPQIDAHDTVIRFGGAPIKGKEAHVGQKTSVSILREVAMPAWDPQDAVDEVTIMAAHAQNMKAGLAGKPGKGGGGGNVMGSDVWGNNPVVPDRFYLAHAINASMVPKGPATLRVISQSIAVFHRRPYLKYFSISKDARAKAEKLYRDLKDHAEIRGAFGITRRDLRPSIGMVMVYTILHSGLCAHIDLYGFTRDGASHYFEGVSHTNRDAGSDMSARHVAGLEWFAYQVAMANGKLCLYV